MNTIVLAAQATQGGGGGMGMIIMMVAIFAIMWFFMIRPQQKKQKKIRSFQKSILNLKTISRYRVTYELLKDTARKIVV